MDLTPVVAEVLKLGFAGAVIVVLFFALKSRDASFRESQDKRISESQANTERFLTALAQSNENGKATVKALEEIKIVIQALTSAFNDVKRLIEEGGGNIHRSRSRFYPRPVQGRDRPNGGGRGGSCPQRERHRGAAEQASRHQ
jgi:hypothetical protein